MSWGRETKATWFLCARGARCGRLVITCTLLAASPASFACTAKTKPDATQPGAKSHAADAGARAAPMALDDGAVVLAHASDAGSTTGTKTQQDAQPMASLIDAATAPAKLDAGSSSNPNQPAATPDATPSTWTHGVGALQADDSTIWCSVHASGARAGHIESSFRRVPSDADEDVTEPYRFANARLRARFTCSASAAGGGETMVVTTADSEDANDDVVSADCPAALPYGSAPECQIEAHVDAAADAAVQLHMVYLPTTMDADDVPHASGETCIASITEAMPQGQLTGFVEEWMDSSGQVVQTVPLLNEQVMRSAQVGGTDEGAIFYAQGKLYFSFGDTSDIDANDPVTMALEAPPRWRSNVLAHTEDFDASDGIQLAGFELGSGSGSMAQENIKSPHETQEAMASEFTAIPLAGFGLTTAAGHRYRFLWFVSVHRWLDSAAQPDFQSNYSTLAYSLDESADWVRLTSPPTPSPMFGPGTIWFDRYNRWLYFFGITPDHGGLRLARVRSSYAKLSDPTQYQYWNGKGWVANDVTAAIELIAATGEYAPRSEMSVAYNPAANVWMMMLVNWFSSPTVQPSNQVELWQAPAVTGPWKKVAADAQLPNGNQVLIYGPMVSEHLLLEGGLEIPVLLSQMYPVYNVHQWKYRINVAQGATAAYCPH